MNDEQEIWYGFCTYWTDEWDSLSATEPVEGEAISHGIPCCPKCGSVGYQMTLLDWNEGIEKYEAEGHTGYAAFIEGLKEQCNGKMTIMELWEQRTEGEG